MDFRQLYYFQEIVNQGSISKAAEVLHIAQPPLSQQLKKLENELGTTLIHRYRQKWELTETGELFLQYATQMLARTQDIKQQIQEIEQGIAGTIRLGVSSSSSNILIDFLSVYREEYPNIKIEITNGNSEELLNRLQQKDIDIALLSRPENTHQFEMKIGKKQSCVVIIPKNWSSHFPSKRVTFKQMEQFPFILLGALEGLTLHEEILKAFQANHVTPNIVIESKDIPMVITLVSKELGISVIPKMDYSSSVVENISIFELDQFDLSVEPVFLKLKEEPLSKAGNQFWDMID